MNTSTLSITDFGSAPIVAARVRALIADQDDAELLADHRRTRCLRPALVAYGSADARVLADAPLAGHYVRSAA